MAFLREVPSHRCGWCSKTARYEVVNRVNAVIGYACKRCGQREVMALNREGK